MSFSDSDSDYEECKCEYCTNPNKCCHCNETDNCDSPHLFCDDKKCEGFLYCDDCYAKHQATHEEAESIEDHASDCSSCYGRNWEQMLVIYDDKISRLPRYMRDAIDGMTGSEGFIKETANHRDLGAPELWEIIKSIHTTLKSAKVKPDSCIEVLGDGLFLDGKHLKW